MVKLSSVIDYLFLAQLIGAIIFLLTASNRYENVIVISSAIIFFSYWVIKIAFGIKIEDVR